MKRTLKESEKVREIVERKGLRSDLVFCMLLSRGGRCGLPGQHRFGRQDNGGENVARLLLCVIASDDTASLDRGLRFYLGCWHNDLKSPVLKHGPRV